jgi:hypothetical protein
MCYIIHLEIGFPGFQFLQNKKKSETLLVREEARAKNICSTEGILDNTVACLIACQRKALLREYGFVTSFVKCGVMAKSFHY